MDSIYESLRKWTNQRCQIIAWLLKKQSIDLNTKNIHGRTPFMAGGVL